MEIQTAIDIITDIMGCVLGSRPCCDRDCDFCTYRIDDKSAIREAFDIAVDSLNNRSEAEEYRTPKKVIVKHIKETNCDIQYCPVCHVELGEFWPKFEETPSFCTYCGQALDWSEVE